MSDRRLTPANGRVAAAHLRGQVDAESYVKAKAHRVNHVVADLCSAPSGARDRQLLRGETFMSLDLQDGYAFGYAEKDGYVGWVETAALVAEARETPTHRICVARSYGKSAPGLKAMGRLTSLPFGAQLAVLDDTDGWARVAWAQGAFPTDLFVPSGHLVPVNRQEDDPVTIAELFLGTPYLWGGNSAFGIDCSGLIQAGCLACGISCPGDSDLQQAALGSVLPENAHLQRGDLLFWKGHVAWVVDPEKILHANAHHMAVAYEPLQEAIDRIAAQGEGPVTARKRLGGQT